MTGGYGKVHIINPIYRESWRFIENETTAGSQGSEMVIVR
jgi:hypothetical protein